MMRIAPPRSVWATTSRRPRTDEPMVKYLCSEIECSGSRNVVASESPNTVVASRNPTSCFRRFAASFRGSHSNSIPAQYKHLDPLGEQATAPVGKDGANVQPRKPVAPATKAFKTVLSSQFKASAGGSVDKQGGRKERQAGTPSAAAEWGFECNGLLATVSKSGTPETLF